MKRFTIKLLLFLAPFLIPVIIYVAMDPFMVLYKHAELIQARIKENCHGPGTFCFATN